eukprot:COSAG04_NODE_1138_length_8106_cov_4.244036_2_plen_48_part_00
MVVAGGCGSVADTFPRVPHEQRCNAARRSLRLEYRLVGGADATADAA